MQTANTIASLAAELRALGVAPGMVLMVHSSLGKVGWTVGGPVAVIRALLERLGPEGTLVMPAESPELADPARWKDPRVLPQWHDAIREHLPLFDPRTTPTTMGAVPEAFRSYPDTCRSGHPLVSVCANGRHAEAITAEHPLAIGEGPGTPFEKLYALDGHTLLLGIGFDRCTSLHYAESLTPNRRTQVSRYLAVVDGERRWVENPDMAADNGRHFPVVGKRFMATGKVRVGKIGQAESLLFPTRALVDFAEAYFREALA